MSARQTEEKITALYERLSHDDESAGDSNSIVNQSKLAFIRKFFSENSESASSPLATASTAMIPVQAGLRLSSTSCRNGICGT